MKNSIEIIKNIYKQNKERDFIIDSKSNTSFTYKEVFSLSFQLIEYFDSLYLEKRDKIAVIKDNSIDTAIVYFASMLAGITVVPINANMKKADIEYIKNDSNIKYAICDEVYKEKVSEIFFENIVNFNITKANFKNVESTFDKALYFDEETIFNRVKGDDDILIIYTSGTTSKPKGVIHNLDNLVLNGSEFVKIQELGSNSRFINLLHMTYLGGYYNLLLIPYLASGSTVITDAYSNMMVLNFWEPIIKYSVNTLWLVPTIMSIMMEMDRDSNGITYCKENVINLFVGTAPLSSTLKNNFQEKYGLKVVENYGLSETLFISTNTKDDYQSEDLGKILDSVDVKIKDIKSLNWINDNNKEGEIFVKTPYLMKSYVNIVNELEDGYFPTGDIGYVNDRGAIKITSRKKDIIIRGGINISPASIEDVIYSNNDVLECAVVGIPHNIMGEEIVAVIRISKQKSFEDIVKSLKKSFKKFLPITHQPTKIVEISMFPHTYSGKIQKNKIKSWIIEKKDLKDIEKIKHAEETVYSSYFKVSDTVSNIVEATSIRYNMKVYDLKKENKDIKILSYGESYFDIPLFKFDDLPYPSLYHYGSSRGLLELREVLSEYYQTEYEVNVDPNSEMLITAGSKVGIYMILLTIVDPGDEVIIQDPAWVSYTEQIKLCHAKPVQIPYDVSVFDYEKYITNKTKMIIINNPNNPSGKVYTFDELSFLFELVQKYNLFLLSDEAYSDFLTGKDKFLSFGNLDKEKKHTIICNSISKNCGISGWRLGYVISNKYITDEILKVNQHLITCPPTILEFYMAKHFNEIIDIVRPQIVDLIEKRKEVISYMDEIGLGYLEGSATFYIFASIEGTKLTSEEFCSRLIEKKLVATVPGLGYGESCDKFIRLSIGVESLERIYESLDDVKELIEETKV
jgi:aminotransferase